MDIINYLKDAQLVANFQNFFGIQSLIDDQIMVKCNGGPSTTQIHEKFDNHNNNDNNDDETNSNNLRQRNGLIKNRSIDNNKIINNHHTNGSTSSDQNMTKNGLKSPSQSPSSSTTSLKETKKNYVINNLLFYYIFCLAASFGYEAFYALFFPFFMLNIDSYVGRRLISIWFITMYVGQALKDIIRWNRPKSPPVVVLEPEYSMEYGMPSTHAMVGFALPFSVFIFTQSRYIYPFWFGLTLASIWCIAVCSSRLYLGMHTVLDILVGVLLSATILFACVPFIDYVDELHFKSIYSPLITFTMIALMAIYYPKSDRWSPARGDTCVMIGFGYGTLVGTWLNYQLGTMTDFTATPPFEINWPNRSTIYLMIIRTILVTLSIELSRKLGKKLIYPLLCRLQGLNSKNSESLKAPAVEVPLKLIIYSSIGINVACLIPILFKKMNLDL